MKEAKSSSKKGRPSKKSVEAEKETAATARSSNKERAKPSAAKPAPVAVTTEQPELPATHGKISIFGGPKDRGIKPDDKLALPTGPHGVYERVRTLNPKSFYCSMRWNYHVHHMAPEDVKRWWANKKLQITNSKTGAAIVARAVDYGPHENTGLDIGLSPGAAEALSVEAGDEVDIVLADPKLALGPIESK